MEYDKGIHKYKPLDAAVSQLGDTAVVFYDPKAFFMRLSGVYQSIYPDRYVMEIYEEAREVRIEARVKDNLRIIGAGANAGSADLELGDACVVPCRRADRTESRSFKTGVF